MTLLTVRGRGPSVYRRLGALGRAELTLLARNRGALVTALLMPLALPFSVRPAVDQMGLKARGLSIGTVTVTAAIGFCFLFAVYTTLVGAYVARREELVLKRLRTGELEDSEILAGTALPAVCVGLTQSLVLAVGCAVLLGAGPPRAPSLTVLGLLSGLVLSAALAALTASFTRTVESAQITAQYQAYRAERARQRVTREREEVRQATLFIHAEGLSPSLARVARRLSDGNILRRPEAKAVWRALRRDLGYDP